MKNKGDMETVEVTRERERKRRKEGNNYLVGGENRKHTIQEKKLTRSFLFSRHSM
jgi:hypothetical protein